MVMKKWFSKLVFTTLSMLAFCGLSVAAVYAEEVVVVSETTKTATLVNINRTMNKQTIKNQNTRDKDIKDISDEFKLDKLVVNNVVVIDPGHGGRDSGATVKLPDGTKIRESDLNLDIAINVRDILENAGVRVVMTRETDVYLGLYERADIANEKDAHFFVSIHNNSSSNADAFGSTVLHSTYVSSKYAVPSKKLAEYVQAATVEVAGTYKRSLLNGDKMAVIRTTNMPAVITESAFLTNESDLKLLMSEGFRKKVASGIAKGIIKALNATVEKVEKMGN